MSKTVRILILFLVFDALVAGAYFGYKALSAGGRGKAADDYAWMTVDEAYQPQNSIEEFIKSDAVQKGLLPVYLKNYGRNPAILKTFRGSKFAGAAETVLEMSTPGLDDWMLVDLKYKNEKERDVQRTILYVQVEGRWTVADSGRLMK